MKVLHVIAGLSQGGAEAVLYRLVSASRSTVQHTVVSLTGDGFYGSRLRDRGAKVHALDMRRSRLSWRGVQRLYQIIRQTKPDVVQTWMHHANLLGGGIAWLAGVRCVVWGIHSLNLDPKYNSLIHRLVGHTSALFSDVLPVAIVFVSKESIEIHRKLGFRSSVNKIIPNGVDLIHFRINETERIQIRSEWGIGSDELLLGFVARWDPYKDHRNLLEALSLLAEKSIVFRCALVGSEMDEENLPLTALIAAYGLVKHIILAGPRPDIPAVMNALDLHVLSSIGEAFPNAILEAMACGTPCVTTDVGGVASIVGDTGWVVPPRAPEALATAIESAIGAFDGKGKGALGRACRERIEQHFNLNAMVDSYIKLWKESVKRP